MNLVEAKAAGKTTYLGNRCEKHGTTSRYVKNGNCIKCRADYSRQYHKEQRISCAETREKIGELWVMGKSLAEIEHLLKYSGYLNTKGGHYTIPSIRGIIGACSYKREKPPIITAIGKIPDYSTDNLEINPAAERENTAIDWQKPLRGKTLGLCRAGRGHGTSTLHR